MLGIFLLSACSVRLTDSAVCDGLSRFIDAHNEALLDDGGDASIRSGASLISAYDQACGL